MRSSPRSSSVAPRAKAATSTSPSTIRAEPILGLEEAFASPPATGRQMRLEIEHPSAGRISQVGAPWKLDGSSSPIRFPPPRLGEHTDEVVHAWLGSKAKAARR